MSSKRPCGGSPSAPESSPTSSNTSSPPKLQTPTQIEEIEYVVRWLFDHAGEQGVDPAKIGVGGVSAGGNMTCVIALKLRDENGPRLAVQVPLSP